MDSHGHAWLRSRKKHRAFNVILDLQSIQKLIKRRDLIDMKR